MAVGYKQCREYFDTIPELNDEITAMSYSINTTRYDPTAKKTSDLQEFLKRPVKYQFNIVTRQKNLSSCFKHILYFSDKEKAENTYKQLKLKYFDQNTKYFLDKLNKGKKLTKKDTTKLALVLHKFSKEKD